MRLERDDRDAPGRRLRAQRLRHLQQLPVPDVNAVEIPDRQHAAGRRTHADPSSPCRVCMTRGVYAASIATRKETDMAIQTKTIDYTHNNITMKGFLAFDDATPGKRPGVLVCHEWWGLNDYIRGRAKQLAQLGYVAFALDMYGNGADREGPQRGRAS